MKVKQMEFDNYHDILFNPIVFDQRLEDYRAMVGDTVFSTILADVFNYIGIDSSDGGFYDELSEMYVGLDIPIDNHQFHFDNAEHMAVYVFEYIHLRPEYHLIFFLDVANVELSPISMTIHGSPNERAISLYQDRSHRDWTYIDATKFSYRPSHTETPSGYF